MSTGGAGLRADTAVGRIFGIGHRQVQLMKKLGIETVSDLLTRMPRRYEDTTEVTPLAHLTPGRQQTGRVRIRSIVAFWSPRQKKQLVEATVEDESGVASAVWFNHRITRGLTPGMEVLLAGKVVRSPNGLSFQSPKFERSRSDQLHVGRLAPVYSETQGLSSRRLRELIEPLLPLTDELPDRLPPSVRASEGLPPLGEALRSLHSPANLNDAEAGRERVAFEELFLLQVAAERARRRRLSSQGIEIAYVIETAREFAHSLPFRLTDGQRVAAHEILTDMADPGPMNRLLQGDVGSGKTVVAAMAALMTHRAGRQTAVMAPTEILARQHFTTLESLLAPHDLPPRLLLGSTSQRARREILDGLAGGQDALIVGTHALIEDEVVFADLGLVVVDEQHRFGVAQRQRLRRKAQAMPNFLAMSATPIPRSLHLTLYGDVNASELREMPPGRQPVRTRVVPPFGRDEACAFIRTEIAAGRQAFVICPLIEESDKLGVKSATAEFERLSREVFPELRVALLHGRLPAREKETTMDRFACGESDILVATSVVEVGVDVANATIMLIEGAERFGLAQLHQFRGRVGRGQHRSHCLLFQGAMDVEGSQRLEALASTESGFDLAELDLRLRGPGDVVGLRQHGLPEMMAADLLDIAMLQRARRAAVAWLDNDPDLTAHGPLREAMHGYRAVFDLD
ncbi:MAG: ATP-dependent DNA helicase RecG [Candidatus Dormibacteria bacterium]